MVKRCLGRVAFSYEGALMGSNFTGILDAIEAISIDFSYGDDDYVISAQEWDKPRANINSFPTRIIAPLATNPDGNSNKISLGKRGSAEWILSDVLLWRDLKSGRGIETDYPLLATYMQAYTNIMLENRLLLSSATITDVQLTIVTHNHSNKDYSSVVAVLKILETFSYG